MMRWLYPLVVLWLFKRKRAGLLALTLLGCQPTRPPCTYEQLGLITAECVARVRQECAGKLERDCPVVAECDRRIDEWRVCQ